MKVASLNRRLIVRLTTGLLCLFLTSSLWAQEVERPNLQPYFVAIIVSDLDSSLNWYQKKLGFTIENELRLPERGLGQANLTNGQMKLELIELATALAPSESIPDYGPKTKLQGLFKFGFTTPDFDEWMEYLQQQEVSFQGDVVQDPVRRVRMIIVLDPDGNRIQLFEERS